MITHTPTKITVFLVMNIATIIFAAVVTYAAGAAIQPGSPELRYLQSVRPKKIVIDLDTGVDDALAVMLTVAKNNPRYPEIIAITCTHGNTNVTQVTINILRTLRVLKKDIPVYIGSYSSITTTPPEDNFFGKDGFGDVPDPNPPSVSEAQPENAVDALIRLAKKYKGELGLVALGPLTNVALASRMDKNFRKNLKALYWLGGSVSGIGNVKPGIEFNAYMDPEANFVVYDSEGPPVITFPWETCIQNGEGSKEWRINVLGSIDSPLVNFLNAIEEESLSKSSDWSPADSKAMSVVLEPRIVLKAAAHYITALYQGDGRGALMVDYNGKINKTANAIIIQDINNEMFHQICIQNLS